MTTNKFKIGEVVVSFTGTYAGTESPLRAVFLRVVKKAINDYIPQIVREQEPVQDAITESVIEAWYSFLPALTEVLGGDEK